MKLKTLFLAIFALSAILFSGCTVTTDVTPPKKVTKPAKHIKTTNHRFVTKDRGVTFPIAKKFIVTGEGIAPQNTISPAQALVLAKRAAIADAYRQFGEKLYGVKVNAQDTVKDAALKDSRIITQVDGLIKNASIIDTSFKDGIYKATMMLKIDKNTWTKIFSYANGLNRVERNIEVDDSTWERSLNY